MPLGVGYGKKASKKLGIPMKDLKKMKRKKGNITKFKGYKGESD